MTRFRLAALAALILPALLLLPSGGEAQTDDVDYTTHSECNMKFTSTKDKVKVTNTVRRRSKGGRGGPRAPHRRGDAAAIGPAAGVKVVTKLKDLTDTNGNNVVVKKDSDRTNDDGIAKTTLQLNNFGNYKVTSKVKVDGDTVASDAVIFGVSDRVSGKCGPPLGAGEA
jgi:hypothetical protein